MNDITSWQVLCPVENKGKTRWLRIGRAYRNRDGSTNVYLDALPSNSRLQLREWEERDDFKSKDGPGRFGSSDALPADLSSNPQPSLSDAASDLPF